MKHYNFKEIKERGSCVDFAEQVIGTRVTDGRCVAIWRDGERDSVAIDREKWYDHAAQEGGGLIELCAKTKFGGMDAAAIQQALQAALSTKYGEGRAISQEEYGEAFHRVTGLNLEEELVDPILWTLADGTWIMLCRHHDECNLAYLNSTHAHAAYVPSADGL